MGGEELYILKHKDLDTAMVKINPFSGRIEYILEVYLPERSLLDAASFKRTVLERY